MVSRNRWRGALVLVGGLLAWLTPLDARAACTDLLPGPLPTAAAKRLVSPLDLARLRQIGLPEGSLAFGSSALAISPGGTRVAFITYRADPARNATCVGLAVADIRAGTKPQLLDQGGDLILTSNDYRGVVLQTGFPVLITPCWSPDGRSIGYLRRDHDLTQVWVADSQSGNARQLTHAPIDVEQFAWRADGKAVVYASRTGRLAEQRANAAEALTGFHYDKRFLPMMQSTPLPDSSVPLTAYAVDLATGIVRSPEPSESALLPPDPIGKFPPPPEATAEDGRRVFTQHTTSNYFSPRRLVVTTSSKQTIRCETTACEGRFVGLWWQPNGGPLVFERREGWANGDIAFYRWQPGAGAPQRILSTRDVISDCTANGTKFVCLREGATTPGRIVQIDPANGQSTDIYDPNPEFRQLLFGTVQRLAWRNDQGSEVRGDLVLPPGYRPGTRLPLIVTTYISEGFLRGGTGDEYPIHVFAAHGFAVLSYTRPATASVDPKATTYKAAFKAATANWSDRRAINSAVLNGVQRVIDMGIADPARVGITGLSDGSSTVTFAITDSRRFAAAAISTCCLEPLLVNAIGGPAFAAEMRYDGWPPTTADDRAFWAPGSLIQNAAKIDTPLLMQLADHEYLPGVDVWAALREQGKPIDMYVFPDEFHIKWQPAHRLAAYERNLDWFDFWLQGKTNPDPAKRKQFAEWEVLRAATRKQAHPQP